MNSVHNIFKTIFLLLIISLLGISCDKECPDITNPACENYDPCSVYIPANADFDAVYIPLDQPDCQRNGEKLNIEIIDDTLIAGGDILFRSRDSLLSCRWQIGTDPRIYTGHKMTLFFPNHISGDVKVTLYAEKTGPTKCTENNYTRDTLFKILHFLPLSTISPGQPWSTLHGKWKGVNTDAPNDTFTIDFPYNAENFPYNYLNNLPVGCQNEYLDLYLERNFVIIRAVGKIACKNPCGFGYMPEDDYNSLVIDYWLDGQTYPERIQKKFIGKRVD